MARVTDTSFVTELPPGLAIALPARRVDRRLRIDMLPKPLLCVPLVAHWLLLGLRYRSLTLPSALNPAIETGGLAGESKAACLAQIGADFVDVVAHWTLVVPGDDALTARAKAGIDYKLVAKPDIGWCGYGVQRVDDDAGLARYAAAFPRDGAYLLQRWVAKPNEAGLFYGRQPGQPSGRVLAMTFRHPPHLIGDGTSTLAALLHRLPKTMQPHVSTEIVGPLARVPTHGEHVPLTTVASLRVGAVYEDATRHVTPALERQVNAIARSMPDFHVGRFDVRFDDLDALQAGRFTIIEVNGAGSEAIHLWDPALPITAAFGGIVAKQRMLFAWGQMMRLSGTSPVGIAALARAWLRQQSLIARYPASN